MLRGHLQKTLGIGASKKMPATCGASVLIIAPDQARADSIVFSGAVQVDGSVEGDIRCHRLVVAGRGRVDGAISAHTATIDGIVNGPIDAARIFLGARAAVKGNLTYGALNVATGASVSGICRDRGRLKARERDGAASEGPPPLAFNLARSVCRKSPPVGAPSVQTPDSRAGFGSMKAVWAAYQRKIGALASTPAASQSGAWTLCAPNSRFATTLSMKRGIN